MERPNLIHLAQDIWRQPEAVVRQVVEYDPWFGQKEILLILAGVSGLLALPSGLDMMLLEIVLNLIVQVVTIYSMAWLLWITGKPLGGKATIAELCAAMVWPMIPAIWGTLFTIPLLNVEPWEIIVQGVFYLYSFHIMVHTVAEVQAFSKWRSFWNQLLALILSLLPFLYFWRDISAAINNLTSLHF